MGVLEGSAMHARIGSLILTAVPGPIVRLPANRELCRSRR